MAQLQNVGFSRGFSEGSGDVWVRGWWLEFYEGNFNLPTLYFMLFLTSICAMFMS